MADGLRYENIPEGVRQSVLPSLLTFWTANLPEHPQWKTSPPPELTGAVRKILLRQIGVRNAENTLYQNVLQQVSRNYADMTLADMTGDTLTESLFSTEQTVPGMFTRQAWEGQVREAIEQVVTARREEIDWVLSDRQQDTSADISPDTLRNRLTLTLLYRLCRKLAGVSQQHSLEKEDSLSGILDQLTLMADARQSPLIALTDTLAWQAAAGRKTVACQTRWRNRHRNCLTARRKRRSNPVKATSLSGRWIKPSRRYCGCWAIRQEAVVVIRNSACKRI